MVTWQQSSCSKSEADRREFLTAYRLSAMGRRKDREYKESGDPHADPHGKFISLGDICLSEVGADLGLIFLFPNHICVIRLFFIYILNDKCV